MAQPDYPCDAWTTETALTACGCPDSLLDSSNVTAAITAATAWLYEQTGRRFPGVCTTTERPCRDACSHSVGSCFCGSADVVELTYGPIVSIDSVTEAGVAVSSGNYTTLPPNYLIRTDGRSWPSCNSLVAADAFVVTYTHGVAVPALAQLAAADLAIEILKSCNGDTCSLPAGTVSVTRRGVSMQLDRESAGLIPRVQMLLAAYPGERRGLSRLDRGQGLVTSGPA